jgi:hypothetical protein
MMKRLKRAASERLWQSISVAGHIGFKLPANQRPPANLMNLVVKNYIPAKQRPRLIGRGPVWRKKGKWKREWIIFRFVLMHQCLTVRVLSGVWPVRFTQIRKSSEYESRHHD